MSDGASNGLGALGAAALRVVVVGAAIGVPLRVLWEHRAGLLPSEVRAHASGETRGWAHVLVGEPSGAEPVRRPEPDPTASPSEEHRTRPEGRVAPGGAPDAGSDRAPEPFLPALLDGPLGGNADPRRPVADDRPAPGLPGDFEVEVARGLTLGEIAQTYYGTARPSVVRALAAYNGLNDPNRLRAGQVVRVPDRSLLPLDGR